MNRNVLRTLFQPEFSVFISHIEMHLDGLWRESGILSPGEGHLRICFTISVEGSKG